MPNSILPPGPRGHLIPTLRLVRQPIEALRDWQKIYGPTFMVNRLGVPTLMTAEPELVGQIYSVTDVDLFDAVLPPALDVLFGARSLLLISGVRHQRERKLMTPPFHGESMRIWAATMAESGRRAFAGGGELQVCERTRRATLEVIVRVVFGVEDAERVAQFVVRVDEWTGRLRPGFLFVRALQREGFGLSAFARYQRASQRVDAMLLDQIARTRASKPSRETSVLASLVEARYTDGSAMADETIRDHLRTLLFAGHETTASTLAWALYFVHRDDQVRARVRAELATLGPNPAAATFAKLPYLAAVVDETLRMRPVTAEPHRLLRKPWTLGPWKLPAGVAVCPALTLIHSRPDLWPEPDQFRPERFLAKRPEPNTFLPFGGGSHRCLGASFAQFEACVILATLLGEFEFELLDDRVGWGRGRASLEPLGGIPMRVHPLSAAG